MKKAISQFLKTFFSYSKSDRHAILILGGFILLFSVGKIIIGLIPEKISYENTQIELLLKELERSKKSEKSGKSLFNFDPNTIDNKQIDTLNIPEFVKRNLLSYRKAGGTFKSKTDFRKLYGMTDSVYNHIEPYIYISKAEEINSQGIVKDFKTLAVGNFNPNSATTEELISFGFTRFQAKNVVEYRNKGGSFKFASDLLKIYGIDSFFYKSIEKHIVIEPILPSVSLEKPIEIAVIELNSADSLELIKVNGIGPVFAKRILKYRQLLGGYYSKTQLLEVYGFTSESFNLVESRLIVDTLKISKIRINFAEYKDFIRHPYFTKNQVESIIKYREKNGSFKEVSQLKTAGIFDEAAFLRLAPYLTCR